MENQSRVRKTEISAFPHSKISVLPPPPFKVEVVFIFRSRNFWVRKFSTLYAKGRGGGGGNVEIFFQIWNNENVQNWKNILHHPIPYAKLEEGNFQIFQVSWFFLDFQISSLLPDFQVSWLILDFQVSQLLTDFQISQKANWNRKYPSSTFESGLGGGGDARKFSFQIWKKGSFQIQKKNSTWPPLSLGTKLEVSSSGHFQI